MHAGISVVEKTMKKRIGEKAIFGVFKRMDIRVLS